jgi:hypothetical protein
MSRRCTTHRPPASAHRRGERRSTTNAVNTAGDRDPFGDLGQRFHLVSTIRA